MVVTFVIAPFLLHETVSAYKVGSVGLIITGVALVILNGPKTYKPYTLETFKHSLDNEIFLVTTALATLSLFVLGVKAYRHWNLLQPVLTAIEFTFISAIIGWYSVLFAKCSAGLFFTSWRYQTSQLGVSAGLA